MPEPIAGDREAGFSIMARLPGRRLAAGEVSAAHVAQAAAFAHRLQDRRASASLPDGSEAAFTVEEHMALIGARVERAGAIEDPEAAELVRAELVPAWEEVREAVLAAPPAAQAGERFVSPSDFGFHNALVDGAGTVRFHDFEYGGWDDGVKLLCDFFCQPEVPVGREHFDLLAAGPLAAAADPARLLLPAYGVKWCCIMLNDFLPTGASRRGYALGLTEREPRAAAQLAKARAALAALTS